MSILRFLRCEITQKSSFIKAFIHILDMFPIFSSSKSMRTGGRQKFCRPPVRIDLHLILSEPILLRSFFIYRLCKQDVERCPNKDIQQKNDIDVDDFKQNKVHHDKEH